MKLFQDINRIELKIGGMISGVRPPILFLSGLIFCVVLVILPELFPAINGREGFVWSPVHSQNYRLGDLYYYSAWLREVLEAGIPAYSPSAGELSGQPLIETWRFLGLFLAALPGYIITDIRQLIVFDYGFSAALFFSTGFLFAYVVTRNCWIGLITGISVLFMTDRLWVPVGPHAERLVDVWRVPASAFKMILHYFKDTHNVIDYDIYGSTFRFINISFSGPILLLYYLLITLAYKREETKSFIVMFLMSPLMAFTYPSHMMIAYGLIVTFSLIALIRRNWKSCIAFTSIGALTLIFLEAIKYRQMLTGLFNKSQLWNNIFASEKLELINNDIGFILSVMLTSKYLLTFLLMIYLTRKRPFLRDIVLATGMVAIPLSSVYLFNMSQLWTRFLGRGIDHLWFMLLTVVILNALYQNITKYDTTTVLNDKIERMYRWTLKGLACAAFVAVVSFSGHSFGYIIAYTATNESRFIPEATMDAYRWIDKNIPKNAEVATLDWEDITLLPIFTNVNLVVGHSVIDGRSPTDELKRFIATWKFLGYNRSQLETLIEMGPAAMVSLCKVESYIDPPCLPDDQFDSSQFMLGIFYWPHIKKIDNIQIVKEGNIAPEFKNFVLDIYDKTTSVDYIKKYNVQYLTMSSEQVALLGIPKDMRLLYKTETRHIFTVLL